MQDKLKTLKEQIETIQAKSVLASDMKAFIQLVLKIIKETKDNFDSISKENLATIQQAIQYIEQEHEKVINSVNSETKEVKLNFAKQVKELKDLVSKVKTIKPIDGQDGEDGYTPIKGKDYFTESDIKDIKDIVLNDIPEIEAEEIKEKLESLKGDKRLDASAIKNLPEQVVYRGGGVSGIKEIIAGTNITIDNTNLGYPIINSTGSGSLPLFTEGSIPFAGADGILTENNSEFNINRTAQTITFGYKPGAMNDETVFYSAKIKGTWFIEGGYTGGLLIADSKFTGPYIASHTNFAGLSIYGQWGGKWIGSGYGHRFQTSPLTAAGELRVWTDRFIVSNGFGGGTPGNVAIGGAITNVVNFTGAVMQVLNAGSVGIGTANTTIISTAKRLHLKGAGDTSATGTLLAQNLSGTNIFQINDDGNVNFSFQTASTVPYLDASKNLISSAVTPTELGYLSGVTSAIQTQLNAKFTLPSLTAGSVLFSDGSTISQNNANLFWDNSNNRLGIGTTSPSYLLDVNGTARATRGIIQTIQTQYINDLNNAVTAIYITPTTGYIGLKTTSPSYPIHYAGATASATFGIVPSSQTTDDDIIYYYQGPVFTGSTNAMLMRQNLTGDLKATFFNQNNTVGTSNAKFELATGGASGGDPSLVFTVTGATNWTMGVDNSDSDKLKIGPVATATGTSLVIDTSGNVGIGTANPAGKLHIDTGTTTTIGQIIEAEASQTANLSEWRNSSGTVMAGVDATGNLLANRTSTTGAVYVGALPIDNTYGGLWISTSTPSATNYAFLAKSTEGTFFNTPSGLKQYFRIANSDAMTLSSTGLGIGTTNPQTALHVIGATLTQVLVEANTAGSGSPNIITSAESGTVYTNEGSTAQNYHTLPTAAAGLQYTFYVDNADGMRIVANTGDIIQINGVVSTTAGYCESLTIGSSVTLTAINATDWVATSVIGTWNLA